MGEWPDAEIILNLQSPEGVELTRQVMDLLMIERDQAPRLRVVRPGEDTSSPWAAGLSRMLSDVWRGDPSSTLALERIAMLTAVLANVGNKLLGIAAESSATAYDTDLDEARAAIATVLREEASGSKTP